MSQIDTTFPCITESPSWTERDRQHIDEPGEPRLVPVWWAEEQEGAHRHVECPRYAACLQVALDNRWAEFGCGLCEHSMGLDLPVPMPGAVKPHPAAKARPGQYDMCRCGRTKRKTSGRCAPCASSDRGDPVDRYVTLTCAECGSEIERARADVHDPDWSFCNRRCASAGRAKKRWAEWRAR